MGLFWGTYRKQYVPHFLFPKGANFSVMYGTCSGNGISTVVVGVYGYSTQAFYFERIAEGVT